MDISDLTSPVEKTPVLVSMNAPYEIAVHPDGSQVYVPAGDSYNVYADSGSGVLVG